MALVLLYRDGIKKAGQGTSKLCLALHKAMPEQGSAYSTLII